MSSMYFEAALFFIAIAIPFGVFVKFAHNATKGNA